MARFYPLYCRRSDGKVEAFIKGKRKELNQPTDEQLDQKPDKNGVSDYYREVAPDEAKHLDWRRKLGGMLAKVMDWEEKQTSGSENGHMLVAFPENYRLYEHVKKTEKDGKTEVKSKTHAAGGNERQDAYLYGHPEGRRKRYRSPADFFPHLLWLCTDESGDPDNCGCKICSPEELDDLAPSKTKVKSEPEIKIESGVGIARQGSGQAPPNVKQESGTPQIPPNSPRPLVPTTLAPPKSQDQHIDRQYRTFMYRPGEIVWFRRGQAWGLGAVLRRWPTSSSQYQYTIQPLSNPYQHPPTVVKSLDVELRPWLAWSVPGYTQAGLNNLPEPPRYETADWAGMRNGKYGPGDMEVDGSILAAKAIDSSYTPLSTHTTVQIEPGLVEMQYDSMFLGAEKIWVGDPLRLVATPGTDILVVHSIVERKRTSPMNQQQVLEQFMYLVGDIYKISIVAHQNPSTPTPASPTSNPQLPPRLTEDLTFRNNRSIPTKQVAAYWKLQSAQTRVELTDVKGRWYEASLLMPILDPAKFDELARKGEIHETSLWMNARGDCVNSNRPPSLPKVPRQDLRKETRREAFGAAIPANAEIRDGVDVPLPDNVDPQLESVSSSMDIDPKFDTAEVAGSSDEMQVSRPGEQEHEGGGGIDDFMNFDGIEDSQSTMPGFGKEYGSQENAGGGYF